MAETVLPGVSIEVRDEGLLIPLGVSVGNLGVVGTASRGPVGVPVLLGSYGEAREIFGDYDAWVDGNQHELTLVRALEQAYRHGAGPVFAVRVTSTEAAASGDNFVATWNRNTKARQATYAVAGETAASTAARLKARTHGTWGNRIAVNVLAAEEGAFVVDEKHAGPAATVTLGRKVVASARNQVRMEVGGPGGPVKTFAVVAAAPQAGQVQLDPAAKTLTFATGEDPKAGDTVFASYLVPTGDSRRVVIRYGGSTESYTVADGRHLVDLVNHPRTPSALVKGEGGGGINLDEILKKHGSEDDFLEFGKGTDTPGTDGADAATTDYDLGFEQLLNEPAHIMVAAGLDSSAYGSELKAHCEAASGDAHQAERIGVAGSALNATFDELRGHGLDSPRLIFVAPGIKSTDAASGREVTLPGAYAAAAVAGMLSAIDPEVSLTNKAPSVDGLETRFSRPQLSQLVQSRVLVLEDSRDRGIRVVKGITTATNTAWHQITTRRIVDYAIFGTRSAGRPFIGRLNNDRVRSALRTAINSFLADMVLDEMLVSYELDVTATRDQEIRGIVQVTMVLRPVFSIDFIKVTIFLQ